MPWAPSRATFFRSDKRCGVLQQCCFSCRHRYGHVSVRHSFQGRNRFPLFSCLPDTAHTNEYTKTPAPAARRIPASSNPPVPAPRSPCAGHCQSNQQRQHTAHKIFPSISVAPVQLSGIQQIPPELKTVIAPYIYLTLVLSH